MKMILALMILAQPQPGPLDAFRANYAGMKVDVDYVYEFGHADAATLDGQGGWSGEALNVTDLPHRAVIGRWECDGSTERYECRTPEATLNALRATTKPGFNTWRIEPFELVWDGETYAKHDIKGESVDPRANMVYVTAERRRPTSLTDTGAPLIWWGLYRFPALIKAEFSTAEVRRGRAVIAGYPTETEVYFIPGAKAKRLEICYDPSVGYLPRYCRISGKSEEGHIKELYLISARQCAGGGFVPTEWIETSFIVNGFAAKFDELDVNTVVKPTVPKIGLGHYRATSVRDRSAPVRLVRLDGVNTIATDEGSVRLHRPVSSLSLEQIKSLVRTSLVPNPPLPPLSRLDREELHKYDPPRGVAGWGRYYLAAGGSVAVLVGVGYFARRRRNIVALILLAASLAGCARTEDPFARLEATFSPSRLVYDSAAGSITTNMVVKNTGNRALKISRADGGCSCRQVDQDGFPNSPSRGVTSLKLTSRGRPVVQTAG